MWPVSTGCHTGATRVQVVLLFERTCHFQVPPGLRRQSVPREQAWPHTWDLQYVLRFVVEVTLFLAVTSCKWFNYFSITADLKNKYDFPIKFISGSFQPSGWELYSWGQARNTCLNCPANVFVSLKMSASMRWYKILPLKEVRTLTSLFTSFESSWGLGQELAEPLILWRPHPGICRLPLP